MSNYDFLKEIPKQKFYQFINRGIIPIHIMDYLTIYERYLLELKKNKKSVCITFCADEYNLHENTIRNIIKFMKS